MRTSLVGSCSYCHTLTRQVELTVHLVSAVVYSAYINWEVWFCPRYLWQATRSLFPLDNAYNEGVLLLFSQMLAQQHHRDQRISVIHPSLLLQRRRSTSWQIRSSTKLFKTSTLVSTTQQSWGSYSCGIVLSQLTLQDNHNMVVVWQQAWDVSMYNYYYWANNCESLVSSWNLPWWPVAMWLPGVWLPLESLLS